MTYKLKNLSCRPLNSKTHKAVDRNVIMLPSSDESVSGEILRSFLFFIKWLRKKVSFLFIFLISKVTYIHIVI